MRSNAPFRGLSKNPHPPAPIADPDESVRILKERPRSTIEGVDANKYIIDHPSMYTLAKHVVYPGGKTPKATRDEVLQRIHIPKP